MKHINAQNIAALAWIAVLCTLAILSLHLSPSLVATLSRGADLGATLSVVRSMIYPRCAIKIRLPPFGARAANPAH
jgi:hypothetical protein